MDLSNFYLMTPMKEYEYMRLRLEVIPDKIIRQYNLRDLVNKQGWVYVENQMGMYGLPQASILANKLLEQQLNAKGYYLSRPNIITGKINCFYRYIILY